MKNLRNRLNYYNFFQISYFLFFLLLPFIFTQSVMDPVLAPRQLYVSVFLLIIWSQILFSKHCKQLSIQLNKYTLYFIIFYSLLIIFSFGSIILANTISEAINVSTKYLVIYLFFITTHFLIRSGLISKNEIINGLIVFLLISITYGVNDILFLLTNNINVFSNSRIITGTFANKNLFASILVLCIWAILSSQLRQFLKYILLACVFALLILIQSKAAIGAVVLMFLLIGLRELRLKFSVKIKDLAFGIIAVAIAVTIIVANLHRLPNLTNTHTLSTRLFLWNNSIEMVREFPFGVGAGNWQFIFPKYGLSATDVQAIKDGYIQYHTPHNDFLWILNEIGIQGLIMYLTMFGITILKLLKTIKKSADNLPFLILIALTGYLIIAFFDFPLERIEHQIILSSLFALALTTFEIHSNSNKRVPLRKSGLIILPLILFSIPIGILRLRGEYCTKEFLYLNKKDYADFVIKRCEQARSFVYTIDPFSTPIDWYKGIALFSQNKLSKSETTLLNAEKHAPYNLHVLQNLGDVYSQKGDVIQAKIYYDKVKEISPTGKVRPLE